MSDSVFSQCCISFLDNVGLQSLSKEGVTPTDTFKLTPTTPFLFLKASVIWIYILVLPASWFADLPTFLTSLQFVVVVYSRPSPCLVSPVACHDSAEELVDYGQGQQSELPRNAAAAKTSTVLITIFLENVGKNAKQVSVRTWLWAWCVSGNATRRTGIRRQVKRETTLVSYSDFDGRHSGEGVSRSTKLWHTSVCNLYRWHAAHSKALL